MRARRSASGRRGGRQIKPRVVWMPGDVRTELHITAGQSDGALCLLIDAPPAGWALPPHRHRSESETIHILEGRFDMKIDGELRVLEAGDSAHIPAGVIHSGGNIGTTTGRRAVIFAPAGIEGFWLEIGKSKPGGSFNAGEVLAAAARWSWDFPNH
jgi:mannose-6-phosphate isomerase-like protein (cupin superfamily)